MALYSYGPTQLWPYTVMALHSYGPTQLWPYTVMAIHGHGPTQLWPYTVMALYSYGPTQLWPYTVMAETVMAHGSPLMCTAQSGRRGQSARPKESQATGGWGSMACTVMAYIVMAYTVMVRYSHGPT